MARIRFEITPDRPSKAVALAFGFTRSTITGANIGGVKVDVVPDRPMHLAATLPEVAARGAPVDVSITYRGEPLQLVGVQWTPADEGEPPPALPRSWKAFGPEHVIEPTIAVVLPYSLDAARERDAERTADGWVGPLNAAPFDRKSWFAARRQAITAQAFFYELDDEFFDLTRHGAAVVSRLLARRIGHRALSLDRIAGAGEADSLPKVAGRVASMVRKTFGRANDGTGAADEDVIYARVSTAFTSFAAGWLRQHIYLSYANRMRITTAGEPDSFNVFMFAELALAALEAGVEAGIEPAFWERLLPCFVRMQNVFLTRWPAEAIRDSARRWTDYSPARTLLAPERPPATREQVDEYLRMMPDAGSDAASRRAAVARAAEAHARNIRMVATSPDRLGETFWEMAM